MTRSKHWIYTDPNLDIAFSVYSGADLIALIDDQHRNPGRYGLEVGETDFSVPELQEEGLASKVASPGGVASAHHFPSRSGYVPHQGYANPAGGAGTYRHRGPR
ncbi:MAG: hypothetical protein WCV90_00865 [Candidatus Woesearchaeota archaeon]